MTGEAREQLLANLLSNEKILTMIYDKTFYSGGNRGIQDIEVPSELKQILEDKDAEGFDWLISFKISSKAYNKTEIDMTKKGLLKLQFHSFESTRIK